MSAPLDRPERLPRLHFDVFTLDRRLRALFRGGARVHLTPRPLETLIVLVENHGRAVGKRHLLDSVWRDTAVTPDVLVQAIGEIRRALGDDKDAPRFVQTVPREGYRFVADVREDAGGVPAGGGEPAAGPRRRYLWLVAATFAVLAGAAALSMSRVRPTAAVEVPAAPSAIRQLSLGVATAIKPAFSPDGKILLYVSEDAASPGVLDLFAMPLAGGNPWRLTERADASGDLPVFTADASHVVFSRYRAGRDGSRLPDLWVVPAFGGRPRLFLPEASGAGFSPDGHEVAYTKHLPGRKALWASPTGRLGEHRELAPEGFTPRWSADGQWIAYTTSDPEGGAGDVYVLAAHGAERRRLTDSRQQVYGLAWTPQPPAVVFASQRDGPFHLWRVPASGSPPVAMTRGLGSYSAPTVSPDGGTIVFSHVAPVRDLFLCPLAGGRETPITSEQYHYTPRFSPKATRVATVTQQLDLRWAVYAIDLSGRRPTAVGDHPGDYPAWLDEDRLAYLSAEPGGSRSRVHVVDLSTGKDDVLASFEGTASWLDVHDGTRRLAAVTRSTSGESAIVVVETVTSTRRTLAAGGQYETLRWRPDGRALAWSGPPMGSGPESSGLWLAEIGGVPRRLLADGHAPVWTPDGGALYFSRFLGGDDEAGLWRLDLQSGRATRIRAWRRVAHYDVAGGRVVFAPDGRRGSAIYSMANGPDAGF